MQAKTSQSRKPLKKIRNKQKKILLKFSDAIRGDLTKINRLKIVALVTIEIHARDVIDKMYKSSKHNISLTLKITLKNYNFFFFYHNKTARTCLTLNGCPNYVFIGIRRVTVTSPLGKPTPNKYMDTSIWEIPED